MRILISCSIACIAPFAGACASVSPQPPGVDVRFVVSVRSPTPSGSDLRTYESGVLMKVGNSFERDLDNQFRVTLKPQVRGETAYVDYAFRDLHHQAVLVGRGTIAVPMNGAADVDLRKVDGRRYSVHFTIHSRELPRSAV